MDGQSWDQLMESLQGKKAPTGSSGFFGVSFNKCNNKYQSSVQRLKPAEREALPERYRSVTALYGGTYVSAEDAAVATDK